MKTAALPVQDWLLFPVVYRCLVVLAFCLGAARPATGQTGQKIALLIGIGDYPKDGGWKPIHAPNDLLVMHDALQNRGFAPENILMLKDQEATRAGILKFWQDRFLPKVHAGDVVYFQFSGHGQQVADDNGDELDGFDEAIVPYDSPLRYQAGVYEGKNLLRDDELNNLFSELRRRLGPGGNLMVVIDACHSGTATRGMGPARGTDIPMASDTFVKNNARRPADSPTAPQYGSGENTGALAPMAAFFGSTQNQLNFETSDEQGQYLGPLTYALSKKLGQASESTTYRGLFEQIRTDMSATSPLQQPQAEGMLDQELLGGRLLKRPRYYRVLRWNDPGSISVDAGWVAGLNTGAVLGLYPPETRDPAGVKPIARGTVSRVAPFEATLQLDTALTQEKARSAWAYVLEENFGALRLGLSLQLPEQHPLRMALLEKIAGNPVIRLDSTPELYVAEAGKLIQLVGPGDMLLESISGLVPPVEAAGQLMGRVLDYTQAKYLRQMESVSPNLKIELELVPVRPSPDGRSELAPPESKRDASGNIHFQNNDYFKVRIRNRGSKAAYFTLIDIPSDNKTSILIPGENDAPAEFRVGAGQTIEVPRKVSDYFRIGLPAGVEMLKLIATEQPVDLRPIVRSRGADTRAARSPLERLFGLTYFNDEAKTRGGNTPNLAAGSVQVQSYSFIIDP